jgi:hypothetical protein
MNDLDLNKKLLNLMESTMTEKKKPDTNKNGIPDYAEDGEGPNDLAKGKKVDEAHPGPKSEPSKQSVKCKDADGKEYTKTVTAVNPTAASKQVKAKLPKGHTVMGSTKVTEADEKMPSKAEVMKCCKDGMSVSEICKKYPDCDQAKLKEMCKTCKEEHKEKEKTDESFNQLAGSLRQKLDAMMNENQTASTSSMPKSSPPVLDNEGVNGYEGYMVGEEEETEGAVLDEAELDEMAEMMRMAGLVSEEEDETERDDHAEKAGREVAHDMEYDDGHDAEDDDHDEKEGRHVAKDIEFDEKEHEAMKSILQKLMK